MTLLLVSSFFGDICQLGLTHLSYLMKFVLNILTGLPLTFSLLTALLLIATLSLRHGILRRTAPCICLGHRCHQWIRYIT